MKTQTVVIKLADPLPCGSWAANDRGTCDKPAYVAYGTPAGRAGSWTVTPICWECAASTRAVYAADLATGVSVAGAYQGGAR